GAQRRPQVRDAAGQAGDLALIGLGEAGLDDVDRGGQHGPDPDAEQQQPRYPPPDACFRPDQEQQQEHAGRGGAEPGDDQPSLRVPPGEPVGRGRGGFAVHCSPRCAPGALSLPGAHPRGGHLGVSPPSAGDPRSTSPPGVVDPGPARGHAGGTHERSGVLMFRLGQGLGLSSFTRERLIKDVVAGIVLTTLLVPQGMAYAELAGLPAITGLYTSILCLLGYAVVGPSRVLVLGPDSALGPIIAATIAPLVLADGDPSRAIALASVLGLMVGALMTVAGMARFGFVADLLSRPTQI